MNSENILDAIGMVDDDLLEQKQARRIVPAGRKIIAMIAAILIMALSVGAAAASGGDFQQWREEIGQSVREMAESAENVFLKVFQIETPEKPPESTLGPRQPEMTERPDGSTAPDESTATDETTQPSEPMLEYVTTVDIEGAVYAYYFSGTGFRKVFEGGFYTYPERTYGEPPETATFWEITKDGVVDVGNTRVDFMLNHGDRDLRIVFDYAVLAGKICIRVWPEGMSENPYGNGWNATAIGNRTDVVLLSIPVSKNLDYTHDYFILDLETLETTNLLAGIAVENLVIDCLWETDDLKSALLTGYNVTDKQYYYWICDLEKKTLTDLEEWTGCEVTAPYFLDDRTLVISEYLGDQRITVARYDIYTGERTAVVENVLRSGETGYRTIYSRGAGGAHGLVYEEDGSVWLVDLWSCERNLLAGLDMTGAYRIESPDGETVLFAYQQRAKDERTSVCYPKIGLLDTKTGVMKVLTRDISGNAEYVYGFLDQNTVVICSRMDEDNGYYLYVYEFT